MAGLYNWVGNAFNRLLTMHGTQNTEPWYPGYTDDGYALFM